MKLGMLLFIINTTFVQVNICSNVCLLYNALCYFESLLTSFRFQYFSVLGSPILESSQSRQLLTLIPIRLSVEGKVFKITKNKYN